MNGFFRSLSSQSTALKDIGLLVMRVGLGLIFMRHGSSLLFSGADQWVWLGASMANIGITFFPAFWGFSAALTEFLGGIMLTVGFGTRAASFLLSIVMLVAFIMHVVNGDSWATTAHPLSMLTVFIGLVFAGSGRFSLDYVFFG